MKEIFDNIKAKKQTKLFLKVKAGAKHASVDGWVVINNEEYLKLSIRSLREKGKANKEIIEYLSKQLSIPRADIDRSFALSKIAYRLIAI